MISGTTANGIISMYSEFQQKRESIEQQTYTTKMTKEDFFLENEEKEPDGSTNL